jgi:hypothetical protein
MPKSRQRKNQKQKSLARTKRVKAEQSKFEKEYQAKMMEQIEKLREKFEKEKEQEVLSRTSDGTEVAEITAEFQNEEGVVLDETNSLNEIKIDYTPVSNSPF